MNILYISSLSYPFHAYISTEFYHALSVKHNVTYFDYYAEDGINSLDKFLLAVKLIQPNVILFDIYKAPIKAIVSFATWAQRKVNCITVLWENNNDIDEEPLSNIDIILSTCTVNRVLKYGDRIVPFIPGISAKNLLPDSSTQIYDVGICADWNVEHSSIYDLAVLLKCCGKSLVFFGDKWKQINDFSNTLSMATLFGDELMVELNSVKLCLVNTWGYSDIRYAWHVILSALLSSAKIKIFDDEKLAKQFNLFNLEEENAVLKIGNIDNDKSELTKKIKSEYSWTNRVDQLESILYR